METVLIVEDDRNMRLVLAAMVEREGYRAVTAADGKEGVEAFSREAPDMVVTDLRMPGLDGLRVLERILEVDPDVPVIMLTAHGTVESAVAALKRGAFDFMTKPFDEKELSNVLKKALATRSRSQRDARPAPDAAGRTILGEDPAVLEVLRLIERVAPTSSTVLVTGETGTGKELVAREIHRLSDRASAPFIKINCAAIPGTLMESELFGYERGAFTGAVTSKPGRFELADGGTLFLDEISTLGLDLQAKLLQVLQERRFERVGGIKTIRVDFRLVAATNEKLEDLIAAGRFRDDLYYRLNVIAVDLPPLRGRRGDIPLLASHFVNVFNRKHGRSLGGIGEAALSRLSQRSWPGNIRELENVIERAALLGKGPLIEVEDLGDEAVEPAIPVLVDTSTGTLKERSREAARAVEVEMIERTLAETGGNVTRAAERLGLSRKGLQLKIKELDLRPREDGDS